MTSNLPSLIIFYDGHCPMCSLEMQHLLKHDKQHRIQLENIHDEHFEDNFPHINPDKALEILHGEYNGNILLGLDVTHRAWTLIGKGLWVAPLGWPVFKQIAHSFYLLIAKYRHPISRFLAKIFKIESPPCEQGTCYVKTTSHHHRRKQ